MHRRLGQHGNAMIVALFAVIFVGALAAITFSRASDSDSRSAKTKFKNRAELSVDASLQMAISKIQRVGSSSTNEKDCSLLDGPSPDADASTNPTGAPCDTSGQKITVPDDKKYLNGTSETDGKFYWTVRNDGDPATLNPDNAADRKKLRTRVLTAHGEFGDQRRQRQIKFEIVPRAFRYALFAKGVGKPQAVYVGGNGRLLLPPPYRDMRQGRGGNLGADGDVTFAVGARANYRGTGTDQRALYDRFFLPTGATGSDTASEYFNTVTDKRRKNPWGVITVGPENCGADASCVTNGGRSSTGQVRADLDGNGQAIITDIDAKLKPNSTVLFDGIDDGKAIQQMATATALPEYSNWMTRQFKNRDAALNSAPNPSWNGAAVTLDPDNGRVGGGVYTVSDFRNIVSSAGAVTFTGPVFVDGHFSNEDNSCSGSDAITISTDVTFVQGSLIVDGCDITINPGASVRIIHSSRDDDDTGDQDSRLGVHERPAVLIKRNGEGRGGNFTSRAGSTDQVNIDGLIYVEGDMTLDAATRNPAGNFINNGATVVEGTFAVNGNDTAVLRWNPIVQRVEFDPTGDRMGTYSIRTNDQPPPDPPQITNFQTPQDDFWTDRDSDGKPEYPEPEVTFTWDIDGIYDTVECRLDRQRSTIDPTFRNGGWKECGPNSYTTPTISETDTNIDYRFQVRVCNMAGCDYAPAGMVRWFQIPRRPTVTFTTTPTDPTIGRDASFAWTVDRSITTMQCRLDGAAWTNCGNVVSRDGTLNYTNPSNGVSYGTHTFEVRATNYSGASTASHTWTAVSPNAPTVNITSGPANPSVYTTTSATFQFTTAGYLGTNVNGSVQCELRDSDTNAVIQGLASCSSPKTYTGLTNNRNYRFYVRVTNDGGTNVATYDFRIKMNPPSIAWTQLPPNPSAYNNAAPTVQWTVTPSTGITSQQCMIDEIEPSVRREYGWGNCSSPFSYGALSHNGGYYGKVYRFYVSVCNESGCNNAPTNYNQYDWRIYPDPPSIWWTGYPGAIDYNGGASIGYFASNNLPGMQYWCHDARGWVGCDATTAHWFAAGGYCSDTLAHILARNVTADSYPGGPYFHRNCDPPSGAIWWGGAWGTAYALGWQWWGTNAYISQCYIEHNIHGLWWGPAGYCPGSHGTNPDWNYFDFGAGSRCLAGRLWINAGDNSRSHFSYTSTWACT